MDKKELVEDRKNLIKIDFKNLHENWQTQADLFMDYSDESAKATMRLDKLKEQMSRREADLDKWIRMDPDKYGIAKITDSSIKAQVVIDEECQQFRDDIIDLTYESNILKGAIRSHEKRTKALEWITQLWIKNYFAVQGPHLNKDMLQESIDKDIETKYKKDLEDSNLRQKLRT